MLYCSVDDLSTISEQLFRILKNLLRTFCTTLSISILNFRTCCTTLWTSFQNFKNMLYKFVHIFSKYNMLYNTLNINFRLTEHVVQLFRYPVQAFTTWCTTLWTSCSSCKNMLYNSLAIIFKKNMLCKVLSIRFKFHRTFCTTYWTFCLRLRDILYTFLVILFK